MLKWTCRLRDFLESRGHGSLFTEHRMTWSDELFTPQGRLHSMREAEFIASCENGFPEEFRWEKFANLFECNYHGAEIELSGFLGDDPVATASPSLRGRDLEGQIGTMNPHKLEVLWLSPTLFISSIRFAVRGALLLDFGIMFLTQAPEERRLLFAYSLKSFQESELDEPSSLSLEFFCHLTALLPVQYFMRIMLCRFSSTRFPTRFFVPFLSIIPRDAAGTPPATEERRATFLLTGEFNKDDLQAIFSRRFHSEVRLGFVSNLRHESVSIGLFVDLLQHARHPRIVELIDTEGADDNGLVIDVVFSYADNSIRYRGKPSRELYTIAKNHNITELSILCSALWTQSNATLDIFDSYFQPLLVENSSLERVRLRFNSGVAEGLVSMFEKLRVWRASAWRHVCFFDVSTAAWYGLECDVRPLHSVKCWDENVFPSVVLKNFHCCMMGSLDRALIGLAVKAINGGIVYRKATDHKPYDMSIANATVIFSIMQNTARNSQNRFTAPREFH
jgi:hypothetical protein